MYTDDANDDRVYNENATLSIAYYGGKTDIDTIKQNEKTMSIITMLITPNQIILQQ